MKKNAQVGFVLVLALVLGMALSGTAGNLSPEASIATTCKDGINNDGDQGGFAPLIFDIDDSQDTECLWMPFKFGQGEYDGLGGNPPNSNDVASYVAIWSSVDNYPTYFEALVSLASLDQNPGQECDNQVQNAMIEYRDTYNLPDSKTGVSQHQAQCGVSY